MITQQQLVDRIEAHLKATGTRESAFGRALANDPHLVRQLRNGRSPRLSLVEKIIAATEPQRDGAARQVAA